MPDHEQADLLGGASEMDAVQVLLSDLHQNLPWTVARYRHLSEIASLLGPGGTMLFGGTLTHLAMGEIRSSFVHGNFIATILLCQTLAENTLAGFLHVQMVELPAKVTFSETLALCEARSILAAEDIAALKKLAGMRNPLTHFRDVSDPTNLLRRSMNADEPAEDLLERDAEFALATTMKLLSRAPFRVG